MSQAAPLSLDEGYRGAMSDQKTVLVTGANKGIGYEIVRQLVAKGLRVFLTARNSAAGKKAVDGLQGTSNFYKWMYPMSQHRECRRKIRTTKRKARVLINNAAIYPDENVDILTIRVRSWSKLFRPILSARSKSRRLFLPFLRSRALLE